MPEGDTIFRTARTLHQALAGRRVLRFESVFPALTRLDDATPLRNQLVDSVMARGKHLLVAFSGGLVLHTHMRMNGSWHIYQPGERWRLSTRDLRIRIDTDAYVAVGFNIPVAELLTRAQLERHPQMTRLGPDVTDAATDRLEVRRRMAARAGQAIHEVLLDQRVLAGLGNVLKSEVLFVARVNPLVDAGLVTDESFERIMDAGVRLMRMNIVESSAWPSTLWRRTTGSLDPRARLFVYGRAGKPCRACGTPIEFIKSGLDARLTYWCPRCQPEKAGLV